jgi:predicted RNA-binding Zn-ribbon protein involved in translation (DUF1610 family)
MIALPIVRSVGARCSACPARVILHHSRTTHPESQVYEFTCPGCGAVTRVANHETRMYAIPESWLERGYFYDRELAEL